MAQLDSAKASTLKVASKKQLSTVFAKRNRRSKELKERVYRATRNDYATMADEGSNPFGFDDN